MSLGCSGDAEEALTFREDAIKAQARVAKPRAGIWGYERRIPLALRCMVAISGHEFSERPGFEVYLNSPVDTKPEDLRSDIYLSVEIQS